MRLLELAPCVRDTRSMEYVHLNTLRDEHMRTFLQCSLWSLHDWKSFHLPHKPSQPTCPHLWFIIVTHRCSTIDIRPVVVDGIEARPVPGVPHADCVVPAARGEKVWHLCVPHKAPHRCRVTTQNVDAGILCVVPNTDRPAEMSPCKWKTYTLQ